VRGLGDCKRCAFGGGGGGGQTGGVRHGVERGRCREGAKERHTEGGVVEARR